MAAGAVGQGQWGRGPEAQGLGDGGVEEGQASGVTRLGGPGGTQLPPELCPQPLLQLGDTCVTRMSHTCHMQGTTSWGDTCVMWFGEVGPTPGDTQCQGGGDINGTKEPCGDMDMGVTRVWHLGAVEGDGDGHGEGTQGSHRTWVGTRDSLGTHMGTRVGTQTWL